MQTEVSAEYCSKMAANQDYYGYHHQAYSMGQTHHSGYPMSQTTVTCNQVEVTKSTKGASKQRRDQINAEIAKLRELLPLPASTRQRLSQLQLMALVLVYVRKSNYFDTGKFRSSVQFVRFVDSSLPMI